MHDDDIQHFRAKKLWNRYLAIFGRISDKSIVFGIVRRSVDQMDPFVTSDGQQHFRWFWKKMKNFERKPKKLSVHTCKGDETEKECFSSLCRTFHYFYKLKLVKAGRSLNKYIVCSNTKHCSFLSKTCDIHRHRYLIFKAHVWNQNKNNFLKVGEVVLKFYFFIKFLKWPDTNFCQIKACVWTDVVQENFGVSVAGLEFLVKPMDLPILNRFNITKKNSQVLLKK